MLFWTMHFLRVKLFHFLISRTEYLNFNILQRCLQSDVSPNYNKTFKIRHFTAYRSFHVFVHVPRMRSSRFMVPRIAAVIIRPHKINYLILIRPTYHSQCGGRYFKFDFLSLVTGGYLKQNMLPYMQIFSRGLIFHAAIQYAKFRYARN